MLMGMFSAGSTTLGLIAFNYNIDKNESKVIVLRSSGFYDFIHSENP